jgi:uncharacterized protein YjdB
MFNFKAWLLPFITTLFLLSGCNDHDDAGPITVVEVQLSAKAGTTTFPAGIPQTIDAVAILSNGTHNQASSHNSIWSSEHPEIATVSAEGVVTGVSHGTTLIYAEYQNYPPYVTGSISITVTNDLVTSIEIFPGEKEVPLGLNISYQALATFSDGSKHYLPKNSDLVWSSLNSSAATIDGVTGLTDTVGVYDTTITAIYQNTFSDTAELSVINPNVVNIIISTDEDTSVYDGYSIAFTAHASYQGVSGGTEYDVSDQVEWHSSDTDKLSLSNAKGTFTGEGEGTSNVTATFDNSVTDYAATINNSNSITVTIKHGQLETINLANSVTTIPLGYTYKAKVTGTFSGGDEETITNNRQFTWVTENKDIATVSSNGEVKGIKEGKVIITATDIADIKISTTQEYTITEAALTSKITITPDYNYIATGESVKFIATGFDTEGFEYTISNNDISAWRITETLDSNEEYTDGVQINKYGVVTNYPTNTREIPTNIVIKALIKNYNSNNTIVDNRSTILGTIRLLQTSIKGTTLSFVGTMSDDEAIRTHSGDDYLDEVNYLKTKEDGVSGPIDVDFMTQNYAAAQKHCDDLEYNKFTDYRLPTYDELRSVWTTFDNELDEPYKLYTEQKWPVGKHFWTSTVIDEEPEATYKLVDLQEGKEALTAIESDFYYVSCVRRK